MGKTRKFLFVRLFSIGFAISSCSAEIGTQQKAPNPEPEVGIMEMKIAKITSILFTDDVEACVKFWGDFGFPASVTVPGDQGLSFAILTDGDVELMYQSHAMAAADNPAVAQSINRSMVFIEVEKIDDILATAKKYEVVVPTRISEYGAKEIYIRDPGGNVIGFAQQAYPEEKAA